MQHCIGEDRLLGIVHAIQVDGHEQGADLIVGNRPPRHAFNEERDLIARESLAVPFLANYVLRSQSFPLADVTQTVSLRLMGDTQLRACALRKLTVCVTIGSGPLPELTRQALVRQRRAPLPSLLSHSRMTDQLPALPQCFLA